MRWRLGIVGRMGVGVCVCSTSVCMRAMYASLPYLFLPLPIITLGAEVLVAQKLLGQFVGNQR